MQKIKTIFKILCINLLILVIALNTSYIEPTTMALNRNLTPDLNSYSKNFSSENENLELNTLIYEEESSSETITEFESQISEPTSESITTCETTTNYVEESTTSKKVELETQESTTVYIEEELSTEFIDDDSSIKIIKTYDVPKGHSFKSYTNYKLLSSSSPQGKLQTQAYTDPATGIRMVGEYYCAALGTYYEGNIGDKYLVTLDSGNQFKMILCDVKSNAHTDSKHQYTAANGCVIEFYVDYSVLSSYVRQMGDISYINGFNGSITKIQKIEG